MRILFVLLLALPLQGCWFFFFPIPTSMFQEGNTCAIENIQVGGRLLHTDGRTGTVERVIGRHQRCQDGQMPILVDVKYD